MSIRITSLLCLLVFGLTAIPCARQVDAQLINYAQQGVPGDPGLELLQEEPHDLLFFTEKAGGGWAKTLLLPGRTMPADRSGSLKLNVLGIEGKDFSAKWTDIKEIDFWETRLERETKERMLRGDFKGAYPFLSVLIRDFPNRAGLRELRCEFLWLDAVARAKRKELAPTLAMLEELRRYAPDYKRAVVLDAIGRTTDQLMQQLMDAGDLDLAQKMLARLKKDYADDDLQSIKKWNAEFLRMATVKQNEAKAALEAKGGRIDILDVYGHSDLPLDAWLPNAMAFLDGKSW